MTQGPESSDLAQLKSLLLWGPSTPDAKLPTGWDAHRQTGHRPLRSASSSAQSGVKERWLPSFWGPGNLFPFLVAANDPSQVGHLMGLYPALPGQDVTENHEAIRQGCPHVYSKSTAISPIS